LKGKEAAVGFAWGEDEENLDHFALVEVIPNSSFSLLLTNLSPGAVYFYRAYGSNDYGTAFSDETASFTTTARGTILYCATNGPVWGDGSSWEMAFRDIQPALDIAPPNTEIRLAGHTFWVTNPLLLNAKEAITLSGGWEGTGNPGNWDPSQWPTMIARPTGAISNRLMVINAVTGSLANISFQNGSPIDASLRGGALVISNALLVVDSCNFVGNTLPYSALTSVRRYGGALYAFNTDLLITNCSFVSNSISSYRQNYNHGGALYATNGSVTIANSRFIANTVSGTGGSSTYYDRNYGGAVFADAPLTVRECLFSRNRVATSSGGPVAGGAVYAAQDLTVEHSIFNVNRAETILTTAQGSAIFARTNSVL
ncbi:MAG TPA: hypothetical protein PK777_17750, partial [Thermoguttaceae bacterium]|nr:hypothetical protein [Thermoguttaceae bacterium]